ncbi:mannose-6-phosphate isomerase [Acetobacter sp. LMG 1636]|uniref:Mannose-6-phosphate isomerase n=2 Tax=Acetobacter fallax TaxID=1737473 RepID=A0ABX0KJD2_9PROT|nr:AGE family epimerase/isomerase [Acetobacter fallax]NHO34440.1 mannose-6-phosphate isomerase [Acetobacter fallax]NHO37997.1 mannose-6-phosphate isomerase [Acetobacter fallax]
MDNTMRTTWLSQRALPLWSENGYDPKRRLFHERLTFSAEPVSMPALRLMVQARQIATYARASLDNMFDASAKALTCLAEVERRYYRADGDAGWIFSLAPDGHPADRRRDLYAHAFILFAYGWAFRLTGDPSFLRIAASTTSDIDRIFKASSHGGYLDTVPAKDSIRRQNPHMHLFEAYLVLFEASGDDSYLQRATDLVTLCLSHFIDPDTGTLRENFDARWQPLEAQGKNRVEPGHMFEWSWLLSEYVRVAPDTQNTHHIQACARRLFDSGMGPGTDAGTRRVRDAMTESGTILETSTRIWPQTECLRALCLFARQGDTCAAQAISPQAVDFSDAYLPENLNGGWIDRLDENGHSLMDHMPASSLYHVYGAFCEMPEQSAPNHQCATAS